MLWFELVFLGWLLWAGALGLWCRPHSDERAALGVDPGRSSLAGFGSLFPRPSSEFSPAAHSQLRGLRRRVGLAAAGGILPLALIGVFVALWVPLVPAPEPAPLLELAPASVAAPPPVFDATPERPPPAPTMDRSLPRTSNDVDRGWVTVTQADQEALSEARTPTRLYGEARVRPVYANEDLLGIRIMGIAPGSFWDEVGFREGDVVLEVNGELVDDPDASVYFMNSLSREYELIVRVRGGDGYERILQHDSSQTQ